MAGREVELLLADMNGIQFFGRVIGIRGFGCHGLGVAFADWREIGRCMRLNTGLIRESDPKQPGCVPAGPKPGEIHSHPRIPFRLASGPALIAGAIVPIVPRQHN
jgi:hypothetical protein